MGSRALNVGSGPIGADARFIVPETERAADELFRVPKPSGELYAFVSDIEAAALAVADGGLDDVLYMSPAAPITPQDILHGRGAAIGAGRQTRAHRSGVAPRKLGGLLDGVGFDPVVVRRSADFEILARAVKPAAEDVADAGRFEIAWP